MDKETKLTTIAELKKQQLALLEKSAKIAMLPEPKRPSTSIKRAFKVLAMALECRIIQDRIKMIIQQPSFEKGGIIEGKEHSKAELVKISGRTAYIEQIDGGIEIEIPSVDLEFLNKPKHIKPCHHL